MFVIIDFQIASVCFFSHFTRHHFFLMEFYNMSLLPLKLLTQPFLFLLLFPQDTIVRVREEDEMTPQVGKEEQQSLQ